MDILFLILYTFLIICSFFIVSSRDPILYRRLIYFLLLLLLPTFLFIDLLNNVSLMHCDASDNTLGVVASLGWVSFFLSFFGFWYYLFLYLSFARKLSRDKKITYKKALKEEWDTNRRYYLHFFFRCIFISFFLFFVCVLYFFFFIAKFL